MNITKCKDLQIQWGVEPQYWINQKPESPLLTQPFHAASQRLGPLLKKELAEMSSPPRKPKILITHEDS